MDRIEFITSVERRRRWGAAEKAPLVAAMNEPGAEAREIARNAGVEARLFAKRLERGRFLRLSVAGDAVTISAAQMSRLLSGIDNLALPGHRRLNAFRRCI